MINPSSDSSVFPVISPFAFPVQKHLRFQRLKMSLTLTLLVPLRLKLLLEKNLKNKEGLVSHFLSFKESNLCRIFPLLLCSQASQREMGLLCSVSSRWKHNTPPAADNRIKEHNAIKLSVGDYDDGARTGAVTSLIS